jgi:hypothetical protein
MRKKMIRGREEVKSNVSKALGFMIGICSNNLELENYACDDFIIRVDLDIELMFYLEVKILTAEEVTLCKGVEIHEDEILDVASDINKRSEYIDYIVDYLLNRKKLPIAYVNVDGDEDYEVYGDSFFDDNLG